MNAKTQAALTLIALAGLLVGPAAQATDVATLPLKASVLAKPNVIFGLDDSGSMDSELILPTNDGALWWDYANGQGWDGAGTMVFNSAGNSSDQYRKMIYLFPNGTGTNDVRRMNDSWNDHFAIPPTAQLAFTRSPDFNPIYYNPYVTYAPWSPAWVGGALTTYGDASPTAAQSHPAYGTSTFDVSRDQTPTAVDWTFTALPGMTLPATARVLSGGTWTQVSTMGWTPSGSEFVVPASSKYRLSMSYLPATYYLKESCAVNGTSCVSAPNGNTLRRYEIRSGNTFPSGRSYADELQNFANWFQYYRKRKLMLNAAMGTVLENLSGVRMGVVHFNGRPGSGTRVTMYDADARSASMNGRKVAGIFYETSGSGGTPTRETLARIGEEYTNSGGPIQYACQRNNAFILTDGFANVASPTVPSYSRATWGSGAPYETTYDQSLADLALAYYTVNLRPTMATGKVPLSTLDQNPNLHMNTYGLTMGSRGVLYTGTGSVPPTSTGAWTAPTANRHPSSVDDLWHAAINGRGEMYLSDTPSETAAQILAGMTSIQSQTGAQGGVAVSTVNLSRGDNRAYFGTYNPSGWQGDVSAHPIDANTGAVDPNTTLWSASAQLNARNWTTRVIATGSGTTGSGFTAAAGSVVNPGGVYGTDSAVIDYLRGDRSGEGTSFRIRQSLIGAVINSEPAVQRAQNVIYVQSGEGMLHAIDTTPATGGTELWAFVPPGVLSSIGETVQRSYVFETQLDGTPTLGTYAGGSLLVAGMGSAGNSYYALDVSSPRGLTEAALASAYRWQFPAVGDATTAAKVGQAVGRPRIVKYNAGYAVLVTSGYNPGGDGKGRLWMLDASSGAILKEFTTGVTGDSGLAQVSAYLEDDGTVQYVYGGDELGNVWRFDLQAAGATPSAQLLAVLKDSSGNLQPVTAAPELTEIDGNRVVVVGTGRLLGLTDFGNSRVQTMYAIADGTTLNNARSGLVQQVYTRGANPEITSNPVDWATQRGWYVDLPAGEQANTQPTIAYGSLAFTTNTNGGSDCSASSWLYVVNLESGGPFPGASFVSTQISTTANSSAVTALLTRDGKIVGSGQDANGNPWERDLVTNATISPAKNAWREIRRR